MLDIRQKSVGDLLNSAQKIMENAKKVLRTTDLYRERT
jgi:hypothetical protein